MKKTTTGRTLRLEHLETRLVPASPSDVITPVVGAGIVDTTTHGDWFSHNGVQVYGQRGWFIPGAGYFDPGPASNLPPEVTDFRIEGTSDRGAPGGTVLNLDDVPGNLQRPGDPAERAAYWLEQGRYDDGLAIYLTVTGTDAIKVSVYCPDPYGNGHGELLTVRDAATDTALTETVRVDTLRDGKYVSWVLPPGSYEIETQQTATAQSDAQHTIPVGGIGAVFFGPAGAPAPIPEPVPHPGLTFLATDTATGGEWEGVYGRGGWAVPTASPASPQVTVGGALSWTWAAATDDARALQSAAGKTASTWYSDTSFTVTVFAPAAERVSLYLLDWDGAANGRPRSEQVDVLASDGTVLDSRTVSDFSGGVWLNYQVDSAAALTFRITRLAGDNAVAAGVFIN
jgi:hypothetical protein